MKGSPFQRNFGIGSPAKQGLKKEGKSIKNDPNVDPNTGKPYKSEKDKAVLTYDFDSPHYPKIDPETGEYPTTGPGKKGSDWGKKKPE